MHDLTSYLGWVSMVAIVLIVATVAITKRILQGRQRSIKRFIRRYCNWLPLDLDDQYKLLFCEVFPLFCKGRSCYEWRYYDTGRLVDVSLIRLRAERLSELKTYWFLTDRVATGRFWRFHGQNTGCFLHDSFRTASITIPSPDEDTDATCKALDIIVNNHCSIGEYAFSRVQLICIEVIEQTKDTLKSNTLRDLRALLERFVYVLSNHTYDPNLEWYREHEAAKAQEESLQPVYNAED